MQKKNKNFLKIALPILFILFFPVSIYGQVIGTATHTITVNVATIAVLQLNTTALNLNITGDNVVAGSDLMITTNQTTTLSWGTNSSNVKITVRTDNPNPLFELWIEASISNTTSPTAYSAPEVRLKTTADNLILGMGRSSGSAIIKYRAVAYASQGTGTDSHGLTFTITN